MRYGSRVKRLENKLQIQNRPASFWEVFWGLRRVEELDEAGKAMLQDMEQRLTDATPKPDPIAERLAALADSTQQQLKSIGASVSPSSTTQSKPTLP